MRLYCLACAGGTAASFADWRSGPGAVDVQPVEYPGRGTRWKEPTASSLDSLAEAIEAETRSARDEPYAILGHSLGAYVAFAVARLIVSSGEPAPIRLCLLAASAPQIPRRDPIHDLPDDEFVDRVLRYDGVPQEALQSEELLELMIPVLRADFRLLEEAEPGPIEPLPVPISVFGGLSDEAVPAPALLAWAEHTTKSFRCRFYEGGHFFLHDPRLTVLDDVASDLGASTAPESAVSGPSQSTAA